MEPLAEYRFGDVEVRVEHDLVVLRAHGVLTAEATQQMLQLFRRLYTHYGRYFVLSDVTDGGGVPPGLRRLLAEEVRTTPPTAVAFFGGGAAMRGMSALMVGAFKMVGGQSQNIARFETAEEAQEWLAAERQRLPAS